MKQFIAALMMCGSLISNSYGRDFQATGADYGYTFSEIDGWLGIGQDLETFPQADMVFYAAERNGETVKIRHPYTDIYMYTNATSGTPEELFSEIETGYKKGSPDLKLVRAKDISVSDTVDAKVVYVLNITTKKKAQAVASIPRKGVFVSLIMEASSEELLKKNLPDFAKLLRTYKDVGVGNNDL